MKLFESCYIRHHITTLTSPLSPVITKYVLHEVTLPLIWKSQALLCKNPLLGYMNATNLPKELIEMIMLYVGLINIHRKSGSYREMNMNSMRKILEKDKKETSIDKHTLWSQFLRMINRISQHLYLEKYEVMFYGTLVLMIFLSGQYWWFFVSEYFRK